MKLEVLVAAMNQTDYSLVDKMKITTDVIVGNQCDKNEIVHINRQGNRITYLSFNEKGVGLNRNNSLMRSQGDVLLFADDDMVYVDGYEEIVLKEFRENPDADVIIFNIKETVPERYVIKKKFRVHWYNFMRFGAVRIAVKRKCVQEKGIFFNLCFGGGAQYAHGEDTLFLLECIKKRLKVYAVPNFIAELTDSRESTWFEGYNDAYFRDTGVLYKTMSNYFGKLLCLQDAIRHQNMYKRKWTEVCKLMWEGQREDKWFDIEEN